MWFLQLIGIIPGLTGLAQSWVNKSYDAKVAITTAKIGGDRDVAVALVKAAAESEHSSVGRLQAIASSKGLMFLIIAFALPWVAYEWKVVVWDNILQLGTTPAIRGNVGEWGGVIIASLFGSGTVLAAARMYFNKQ